MADENKYLDDSQDDGRLTGEAMTNLLLKELNGGNGDTEVDTDVDTDESGDKPDPAAEAKEVDQEDEQGAVKSDKGELDDEPVILSKDGKRTIEYSKLTDERDKVKELRAELEDLRTKFESKVDDAGGKTEGEKQDVLDKITDAQAADDKTGGSAAMDKLIEELEDEWAEVAAPLKLLRQENQTLQDRMNKFEEGLTKEKQQSAEELHWEALDNSYPDRGEILDSKEWAGHLNSLPPNRRAYVESVIKNGSASAVIEEFDNFTGLTNGKPVAADSDKSDKDGWKAKLDKVREAIDKAKPRNPGTLSDVAGQEADYNGIEKYRKMSPNAYLNSMMDKTPQERAKIEEALGVV